MSCAFWLRLLPTVGSALFGAVSPVDEVSTMEAEFEEAWKREGETTRFELPELDVNAPDGSGAALPVHITALMLWDSEVRKAWAPQVYIPTVVRRAEKWGAQRLATGGEVFWRSSEQRAWMTGAYVPVIERVAVNHGARRVTFLGRRSAPASDGQLRSATEEQPLFLVQHSVVGSDDAPRAKWRMVHLTRRADPHLLKRLQDVLGGDRRPEYLDLYVRRDVIPESVAPARGVAARSTPASRIAWERPFGPAGPIVAPLWSRPACRS
jgi:hypothetical protein